MTSIKSHIEIIVLERIKEAYNIATDTALADFLGVQQSTIANWRRRGSINLELIITKCDGINYNWLLHGEGPVWKKDLVSAKSYKVNQFGVDVVEEGSSDYIPLALDQLQAHATSLTKRLQKLDIPPAEKLEMIELIVQSLEVGLRSAERSLSKKKN